MHYFFEVIVPAGTAEAQPYKKILPLTAGYITAMQIIIPVGHAGTAHLQIFYHEFQLYPLSRGENYHGDDMDLSFADRQAITAEPFELKAVGWNSDEDYDHRFLVSVEVLRLTNEGTETTATTVQDLADIVGEVIGD